MGGHTCIPRGARAIHACIHACMGWSIGSVVLTTAAILSSRPHIVAVAVVTGHCMAGTATAC